MFAFLDFSTPDLLIVLAIVLLLFGSKKLPELSRSLGESVKELKKATKSASDLHQEVKTHVSDVKSGLTNGPTQE